MEHLQNLAVEWLYIYNVITWREYLRYYTEGL